MMTLQTQVKILGIDPGTLKTGFGVIEIQGRTVQYRSSGVIALSGNETLGQRLVTLKSDLLELIARHKPQILSLESLFFAKNAQSALKLGHARGVILATAVELGLEIYEYAPTEVKRSIMGQGRGDKDAIAKMVSILLKLPKTKQFIAYDETDALALALTHAQNTSSMRGIKKNDRPSHWKNSY